MSDDINIAIGRAVLAATSGFALVTAADMKYVRVAYGLYLVDGIIGVLDYLLPKRNRHVLRVLDFVDNIARPCYTPLIAAEAILFAGMDEMYSYGHLVFPVCYIVLTELLKKHISRDVIDLSTIINSCSICYSTYLKQDYLFGGLTALFNIVSFLGVQFNSMEYFLCIGVTNLVALQFLKQTFM